MSDTESETISTSQQAAMVCSGGGTLPENTSGLCSCRRKVIGFDIVAHTSSHIRTKPKAACPQHMASLFMFDCMGILVQSTYTRYQQRPDPHPCVRRVHADAHTVEHTERDALCWGQADGCVKGVSRWACTALRSPSSLQRGQVRGLVDQPILRAGRAGRCR